MTKQKAQRPTVCRICKAALPVASRGRVRYTCSARCRQTLQRYGDWKTWSAEIEYRRKRVEANKKIRKLESRVGSLDFDDNPKFPGLTRRERLRTRIMQGREPKTCAECRMPYITDTWRKYPVCSRGCYDRHKARVLYLDDWCWEHMPKRGWLDRTMYINDHIRDTICAHCGWTFYNRNPKRKYCSDHCKDAAYWKRRPLKTCAGCGNKYRGHHMACSKRCYQRVVQRCGRCYKVVKPGAEILPSADTRIPKRVRTRKWSQAVVFCSGRCRDALGWLPMRKLCKECQQPYYAVDHHAYRHQQFCSQKCGDRFRHRGERQARYDAAPATLCLHCGTEMPRTRKPGGQAGLCSDLCRQARKQSMMRKWREARRQVGIPVAADWLVPEWVGDADREVGYVGGIEAELALVGDK